MLWLFLLVYATMLMAYPDGHHIYSVLVGQFGDLPQENYNIPIFVAFLPAILVSGVWRWFKRFCVEIPTLVSDDAAMRTSQYYVMSVFAIVAQYTRVYVKPSHKGFCWGHSRWWPCCGKPANTFRQEMGSRFCSKPWTTCRMPGG